MRGPGRLADDRAVWRARLRLLVPRLAIVVLTLGLVGMARFALDRPLLAVALVVAIVVAALACTDPVTTCVLVVLGVWAVVLRLGPGSFDISGSDALLVVGTAVALPLVNWANPPLRRVFAAILIFEAMLATTVLAHPGLGGALEWGHRLFLTGGALIVGAALAARHRVQEALRAFLVVATVMAVLTVAGAASGAGFGSDAPAQGTILGFHKNFLGSMMLVALAVSHLAPTRTGLSSFQLVVVKLACVAGLFASQSRGAVVALLVALVVAMARSRSVRRRSVTLLVVLIPVVAFAYGSLRTQLETSENPDSVTEREQYREQGLEEWRRSPAFGRGMRFFETAEGGLRSDPHNVLVATLSETGVMGLAAFVILLGTTVWVLWRLPGELALAALAVVIARLTHGMFDVYWVAATQSLPWILVGMALGERTSESGADVVLDDARTAREGSAVAR